MEIIMKPIRSFFRALLSALVITLLFRPLVGLYSVLGAVALLFPVIAGLLVALYLVRRESRGFFFILLFHIVLVTGFSYLTERYGFLSALPADVSDKLSALTGIEASPINMLKSMIIMIPIYFAVLITVSAILSYSANKKEAPPQDEEYPAE